MEGEKVSNQLISLASREKKQANTKETIMTALVSNQLISLASREVIEQLSELFNITPKQFPIN